MLVNTNRERSPGGTDSTLINPCIIKKISSTAHEETPLDQEFESAVWREDFEITTEEELENADLSILEGERCSSSLSLTVQSPLSPLTTATPSLDQMLGRIPLASRVTVDVVMSHQFMLQSLHDVFAVQKPDRESAICEEPNVSASAVKAFAQKANTMPLPDHRIELPLPRENLEIPKKSKKERRRRKKGSSDIEENRDEFISDGHIADVALGSVPVVPYVPRAVFSDNEMSPRQLGSFEAKEKMLRSLKEKMGSPRK
ncbi:hypothetical protein KIN20_001351 [Parelaphostrongylus tenuis]|uniref:Uncharacterized protein n=1 Tax=Parelaphostrongylus tenuis TaxID=148309 RepID=A0AAD5MCQ6_PARTN|nr:hypothetical protein KIN20_001351 [Parelaphostrongylus tenuis]